MHRFSCGDTWFWFVIIRVMLSEIVCRMLMNVVERCLRDVWVMLRNVCEMSERCFWVILWELLKIFGVMSLECCWGCWRLLKDVLVLSTVSQQSLKLLSHSHSLNSLNNSFPTFSQHSHSLSNLSTVSQQSLNKHGFLLLSLNSISKLSLSLSQSSLNTPIPPALQKQTHSLLDSLFIPAEFPQATPSTCFLNTISIRYFRKTGQYMHESLLT